MKKNDRIKKALQDLDFEVVYDIFEDRDFVEVVGGQGGDVSRIRVYFDAEDNITYSGVK